MVNRNYDEVCEKHIGGNALNYARLEEGSRCAKLYYIPDTEGKITKFRKFITKSANRFLLKKRNSKIREDLVNVIMGIGDTTPSKGLTSSRNQLRRVKWKEYRIIYKSFADVIIILSIGLRKNCYKNLRKNRERFLNLDYTSCQPFELSSYCN